MIPVSFAWTGLVIGAVGVLAGLLGIRRSRRLRADLDGARQLADRRLVTLRRVAGLCRRWQKAAADAHFELAAGRPTQEALHLALWTGELPPDTCALAETLGGNTPAEGDR